MKEDVTPEGGNEKGTGSVTFYTTQRAAATSKKKGKERKQRGKNEEENPVV